MEQSEYFVEGWPWQILGAIGAVATAGESGENYFFCQVGNAQFRQFPVFGVYRSSRNLNTTRRSVSR